MRGHNVTKVAVVVLLCALTQLLTVGRAAAYEVGDCDAAIGWRGAILDDYDLVRVDTGSNDVDLGDDHWWGAPQKPAIICWGLVDGAVEVEFIGNLYWDPQGSADRYGTARLAISFSTDGSSWQSKFWFELKGDGFKTGYIEKTFRVPASLDNIRLQLYRNSDRVYTFHRARGD